VTVPWFAATPAPADLRAHTSEQEPSAGVAAGAPREPAGTPGSRPAVFLDRDGVLNELVVDLFSGAGESPLAVADVRLVAGAAAAAHALARMGFTLICVSNQPAAAKGRVSVEQLLAVHERVLELLACEGVRLDASRLCLHHPDGVLPELSGPCACRKPAPGMLLDAARALDIDLGASWMVGDTDADIRAGRAADCRTLLIEHHGSIHKRQQAVRPDLSAADLALAVEQLRGA
jgi:D-glycero-D-manno-heptose 1,7-bisphosphate phosphatase